LKISAIIPAAGVGKRMKKVGVCTHPKQFWPFAGTTIMGAVMMALDASSEVTEIIIACSPSYKTFVRDEIVKRNGITTPVMIVAGGKERADSVYNALKKVSASSTHVLVQDAVRPFLTASLITGMSHALGSKKGIIAARPVAATIKKVSNNVISDTVDRTDLWEAETPQIFQAHVLRDAYRAQKQKKYVSTQFTDEASLVEAMGVPVSVFQPDGINMKITTEVDYRKAKKIQECSIMRVGIGNDIHRLVDDRPLIIGGVEVPSQKGCLGHSDGDPLLHAVIDALLGAACLGDIGEIFPDTDPALKGVDSKKLLTKVVSMVADKGFAVSHIDTTVILERPKLKKYKLPITRSIAKIIGISPEVVNVKAKTNEGLDSIGSTNAVAAQAVVTLVQRL